MTWFQYPNYGTALQVYALFKVLKERGHHPSVINYLTTGKIDILPCEGVLSVCLKKAFQKFKKLKNRSIWSSDLPDPFSEFLNEELSFTRYCETYSDLWVLNNEFDAFICGSDQIWAPSCFDPRYFLDFVEDSKLKIAYAPSVGLDKINDSYIASQIESLAKRLDFLSVREQSGAKIISELTGRNVECVLDPTFLIDGSDWKKFASKHSSMGHGEDYCLIYMLGNNDSHWRKIERICHHLGLSPKIVPVFESDKKREGCIDEIVTPWDFVSLIANASYICTDSFHGTIFSINLKKDFAVFPRFKKNDCMNQNSRIVNILQKLGLMDRIIDNSKTMGMIDMDVDYAAIEKRLNTLRVASYSFLDIALCETPMEPNSSRNVCNTNVLCCGCGACVVECPTDALKVAVDNEGFFSVKIDQEKCIDCERCIKICPFLNLENSKRIECGELYSYKDESSEILEASSSGGIGYRLAEHHLDMGGIVAGCTFDSDERIAKHVILENQNQLHAIQGSKYLQSYFVDVLHKCHDVSAPIAIFGTPCQIASAKNLLSQRSNIVFIDLICHGVPTAFLFERYIDYMSDHFGLNKNNIRIIFRYKPAGWSKRHICISDDDKTIIKSQKVDLFYRMFEQGKCYLRACYDCPWRTRSCADIRIGDYWGPKYKGDKTGVSMVLALTQLGNSLIGEVQDKNIEIVKKEDFSDYAEHQQMANLPVPLYRNEIIQKLKDPNVSLESIVDKYAKPFEYQQRILKLKNKVKKTLKFL